MTRPDSLADAARNSKSFVKVDATYRQKKLQR